MELDYRYATNTMSYSMNFESAYRKRNKIPQTQRELPIERAKLDSAYYSFLTSELVNNPLAVLVSEYYFFLNRIMFMEVLRGNTKPLSIPELVAEMDKANYKLSQEEKELALQLKGIETSELKEVQNEFQEKYGEQFKDFQKKYGKQLQELYKEKKGTVIAPDMIEEYLSGQKVEISENEKALLLAQKEFNKNPLVQKRNLFYAEFIKAINQFHSDHKDFMKGLYQKNRMSERKENMQKILGIQPGLATDIMVSQDICRSIVAEMTPIPDEKVKNYQKEIATPFIANYIKLKNEETKAKIEANKMQKGAIVNEVPKTAGDKVFDAIMAKYKGKVVYVDFWATWCSPCRSGIERIKPLKDEIANENVAFVYITSPSSPKATYDKMIPTIKGEHYRVTADEWNILCSKFNISGIPHYVLVGKDGKVINPQLGHLENSQLKSLLMKQIKE